MKSTTLFVLVFTAALQLLPRHADALVRVHYDPTNAPATHSTGAMLALITLAMREWESQSGGRARFSGPQVSAPNEGLYRGPGHLNIYWDGTLSSCARTQTDCPAWPLACTLQLHPFGSPGAMSILFPPNTVPPQGTGCQDIYSTLMHELGHNFDNLLCYLAFPTTVVVDPVTGPFTAPSGNSCHIGASVVGDSLGPSGFAMLVDDLASRHLWNFDQDNFVGPGNPLTPVSSYYDFYDQSTGELMTTQAATGNTNESNSYTESIGPGLTQSEYTRVYALGANQGTLSTRVFFDQGDLWTAQMTPRVMLPINGTRHKTCIAALPGSPHAIVCAVDAIEAPLSGNQQQVLAKMSPVSLTAGRRFINCVETHDSGASWSANFALPAVTRSGVSCAVDVATNRVVLAYEEASTEQVMTRHRLINVVDAWTNETPIDVLETNPANAVFSPALCANDE